MNCEKIQRCVGNGSKLLKRFRRTGAADKFDKKKVMVCDFLFNPKEIWISLGIGRRRYLLPMFEFKPEEKPHNNQKTSSEFETESESSDSQCLGDVSNSAVDFIEDIDNEVNSLLKMKV